jgi:hypothetical protein
MMMEGGFQAGKGGKQLRRVGQYRKLYLINVIVDETVILRDIESKWI